MLLAVAIAGWLVAFFLLCCWVLARDDRDAWKSNAELLGNNNRLQSAEHDLEKLLQLARQIRVKRGKKQGG